MIGGDQVLEAMADGVLVLDRQGCVILANPSAARLWQRSVESLNGVDASELFDWPDAATPPADPRHRQGPVALRRGDGTPIPVDVTAAPFRNGAVTVIRDLRTQHRAAAELRQALQRTQERLLQAARLETIGRLAMGVAHEVRNPLAIIQMGLELLATEPGLDAAARTILDDMEDAARRADRVIRALLDFSRERSPDPFPVDLAQIVLAALRLLHHEITQHDIRVVQELQPDLPRLDIDRERMQQVFVNLFLNAIQAMGRGGELRLRTQLRTLSDDDLEGFPASALVAGERVLQVQIQDTGPGIAEAALPRLFEPFFTTRPTGQGCGLGLSLAQNIIKLHHGEIGIANHPAGGAVVTVWLKLEGEQGDQEKDPAHR